MKYLLGKRFLLSCQIFILGVLPKSSFGFECNLKVYQYSPDTEQFSLNERLKLTDEVLSTMRKDTLESKSSGKVFSILFTETPHLGVYYKSESDRDSDFESFQLRKISESKKAKELCTEATVNNSQEVGVLLSSVLIKSAVFTPSKQELRTERRVQKVKELNGVCPGSSVPWYSNAWDVYEKGEKKFLIEKCAKYGRDGTPVHNDFGLKDVYVLTDPDDISTILTDESVKEKFQKGMPLRFVQDYVTGKGMATLERSEHWENLHAYMNPYFMASGVYKNFEKVQRHTKEFISEHLTVKEMNFEREMLIYTMGGISEVMLGMEVPYERLGLIVNALEKILKFTHNRLTTCPFNVPLSIPTSANTEYLEARKVLDSLIDDMIENDRKQEERGEGAGTMMRAFRMAQQGPQPVPKKEGKTLQLSLEDLRDQVRTVFIGGHETTAHLLTMAFYRMSENPEMREKLVSELQERLGMDGLKSVDQLELQKLPYLDAFINEVLRIDSSLSGIPREPLEDVKIGGFNLPKGSTVVISIDGAHRLPEYWKDPETFDPQRFTRETKDIHHSCGERPVRTFIPFGAGDRACIGRIFATMEAKTFIVEALLSGLNPKVRPGAEIESIIQCTTRLKHGLPMIIGDGNGS